MLHLPPLKIFMPGAGGGYIIDGSALFDGSTSYLTWTPSSAATSQYKKTIHIVCKRAAFSSVQWLLDAGSNNDQVQFEAGNALECSIAATVDAYLKTSAVFRDPAAWLDITLGYDTTQAVAADRATLEINGVVVTAFSTATYPSLNHVLDFAENGVQQNIGRRGNNSQWFNGYIARFAIVDGLKLDSSSFGEVTADGYWQINNVSGLTFGTNGFLLKGQDVAAGTDSSGNGNNFTPAGTITAVNDSPTNDAANGIGNAAILNVLSQTAGTYSNGNRTWAHTGFATYANIQCNFPLYAEFTAGTMSGGVQVGIAHLDSLDYLENAYPGGRTGSFAYKQTGQKQVEGTLSAYGSSYTTNDIIGVAYDPVSGAVWFSKNGTWQNSATVGEIEAGTTTNAAATGLDDVIAIGFGTAAGASFSGTWNFGQSAFTYTPPTGFSALATQNMPAADVPNPGTEYYQGKFTTASSGNTTVTIPSDLTLTDGFMVRIKRISGATQDWYYCDTVNGAGKHFPMDATFPSQGRITDANLFVSTSGQDIVFGTSLTASTEYLIEVFKIGDYFSVNNSTMTAGPTTTYNPALGVTPGFIIGFQQSAATNAVSTFHRSLGKDQYVRLSLADTIQSLSNAWGSSTPTASSVTVNTLYDVSTTVTFYNWGQGGPYHFGTQEGNASANGPMATVNGFPQATFIKPVDIAENWTAHFSAIDTYNPRNTELNLRSDAVAGGSGTDDLDFVSNGLKVRGTNTSINPSSTVIYGLFGIVPIQGPGDVNQGRAR